ncbi:MAG: DUF1549 and DUF1553 domain-containing protein [Verrucomicrobiota bacterium]
MLHVVADHGWRLCCALILTVPLFASAASNSLEAGRKHWAFQPVTVSDPPRVRLAAWVKTPVDAFILSTLEANGNSPAPVADKRVLIRRATFDLVGLPPTPEEVEAFVLDNSVDAFAKVVDRLLASPHYGERWGRHWLDVARYADSNGLDENVAHGNAWRYRDYVINAFNRDKPFDQFVVEQIAGDLLLSMDFSTKNERLVATGFLSLGAKVLAEPDPKKMEMDIIDEQIDTLGRAFMGMTLGCARCHDHKFDPIPTEDYYALAAILKSTRTMNHFKIVAEWHEPLLATPEEIAAKEALDKQIAGQKDTISKVTASANDALRAEVRARAVDYLVVAAKLATSATTNEVEACANGAGLRAPILKSGRDFLANSETNSVFHTWREAVKIGGGAAGEEIEKHYRPLFAEVEHSLEKLKAETGSTTNALGNATLENTRKALDDPKGFLALPPKTEPLYPAGTAEELKKLRDELAALEKNAPELASAMGVSDSTNVVKSLPVHVRGSHLTLGSEVPRGFPQVMRVANAPTPVDERHSGRLELARWLAHPNHPLTARVMVNRIWRWHFGRGLVASTENFGAVGDRPSHPQLLDWLAARFIREGWSIKAMHRLIMGSAVYQQGSHEGRAGSQTAAIDPENRLLSHFNIRRLEAEEIRDALLAVAGTLNQRMGGKTLGLKNREFVFNHTSKDATTYDSVRRSIYLPIIRNHLYDEFEQFDYPDPAVPTGSRNETVIAPQALLMMNAELVGQSAERLAKQFLAAPGLNDRQRLEQIYLRAYARPPSTREIEQAKTFLDEFEQSASAKRGEPNEHCLQAWTAFCHAVLAANEFSYLN